MDSEEEKTIISVESESAPQKNTRTRKPPKPPAFETEQVRRKIKVYHVTANELHNLASENTVAKASLSTGCSLTTFAIGVWTSILIDSTPSELATTVAKIVLPICFVLAIVCFAVWWCTKNRRQMNIDGICLPSDDETL